MKSRAITHVAMAVAILAAGCAFNQVKLPDGPIQAKLLQPDVPETVLKDAKLAAPRHVQGLGDVTGAVAGLISRAVNNIVQDNKGTVSEIKQHVEAVGSLREQGLFKGSVLSKESRVVFVDARGAFSQADQAHSVSYSRMVAMFDPTTGDLLAYGLVP